MPALFVGAALVGLGLPARTDAADNPGIATVSPERLRQLDRIVALSDVHGMYGPLRALLLAAGVIDPNGHWAGGRTLLVVVGDSIDKGPQSLEVLALWMRLEREAPRRGGQVLALLGNHEAALLADPEGDSKAKALEEELSSRGATLADLAGGDNEARILGRPLSQYRAFLHRLPAAARLGDWLFCHAGWVPAPTSAGAPETRWRTLVRRSRESLAAGRYAGLIDGDGADLLERKEYPDGVRWSTNPDAVRELERRLGAYGLRGAVFGHLPDAFGIEGDIGYGGARRLIKLDSGMAPDAGGHPGRVLILAHPTELAGAPPSSLHAEAGRVERGALALGPLAEAAASPTAPRRRRKAKSEE